MLVLSAKLALLFYPHVPGEKATKNGKIRGPFGSLSYAGINYLYQGGAHSALLAFPSVSRNLLVHILTSSKQQSFLEFCLK